MTASRLPPDGGIIQRMAEMKDMYRLMKCIEREIEELEKKNEKKLRKGNLIAVVPRQLVIEKYTATHKSLPYGKATRIFNSTKNHGYIDTDYSDKLHITTNGEHFLAKKWFILPVGLWNDSLKAYDTLKTVIISVILSSTFTLLALAVARYIIGVI